MNSTAIFLLGCNLILGGFLIINTNKLYRSEKRCIELLKLSEEWRDFARESRFITEECLKALGEAVPENQDK
jgi:hypothetical protein